MLVVVGLDLVWPGLSLSPKSPSALLSFVFVSFPTYLYRSFLYLGSLCKVHTHRGTLARLSFLYRRCCPFLLLSTTYWRVITYQTATEDGNTISNSSFLLSVHETSNNTPCTNNPTPQGDRQSYEPAAAARERAHPPSLRPPSCDSRITNSALCFCLCVEAHSHSTLSSSSLFKVARDLPSTFLFSHKVSTFGNLWSWSWTMPVGRLCLPLRFCLY